MTHHGYQCRPTGAHLNDVGVLRFTTFKNEIPALPLASAAEIGSFADRGVTLFAAGLFKSSNGWVYPNWMRKSRDHAWKRTNACQADGNLCFQSTMAQAETHHGDSGGAWVGWVGMWKLLAIHGAGNANTARLSSGVSLADPSVRGWIDQQIAAG